MSYIHGMLLEQIAKKGGICVNPVRDFLQNIEVTLLEYVMWTKWKLLRRLWEALFMKKKKNSKKADNVRVGRPPPLKG